MTRKTAAPPTSDKADKRRARISSARTRSRQAISQSGTTQATPTAHSPGALEVSQHNIVTGSIVRDGGNFFAFTHLGVLLGKFPDLAKALRAFREIQFDEVL